MKYSLSFYNAAVQIYLISIFNSIITEICKHDKDNVKESIHISGQTGVV